MSTTYYFEASLAPYTVNGVPTLTNNPPAITDNPFLMLATAVFVKKKLGHDPYIQEAVSALGEFYVKCGGSYKKVPLPPKSWGHPNISHDEVNAIYCVEPWPIYHAQFCWIYNATGNFFDYFRGWYYRFGYLVAFAKVMTDRKPNWLDEWRYCRELKRISELPWQEPEINTSSRCLVLLQSQWLGKFTPNMQKAMIGFLLKCEEQFGDVGGLYKVYFGESHPFTYYTKGIKFL